MTDTIPSEIRYEKQEKNLYVTFDGATHCLSAEYLRVMSPSAEVRGHGSGQEVLQYGKENVDIEHINPVGNYAVQLVFDDGHDTGIYSWSWLNEIAQNHDKNWQDYLAALEKANKSRTPPH
jgi:DUF971 family protein